jgi:membrane-bound lytic murein transglycosylase D
VAAVAKRYGVSAANVAQWNDVSASARFAAGKSIVIHLPAKATGRAVAKVPQRKKATVAGLPSKVKSSAAKR